jgi:hypothetical protein
MIPVFLHSMHHILPYLGSSFLVLPLALGLSVLPLLTALQLLQFTRILPQFLNPPSSLILVYLHLRAILTLVHGVVRPQITVLIFLDDASEAFLEVLLVDRGLFERFLFTFAILFVPSLSLSLSGSRSGFSRLLRFFLFPLALAR